MTQHNTPKFDNPDMLQRYLHNKLSDSERVEFELHMLDNPALVDTVEIDHLYKQTLVDAVQHNKAGAGFWQWIRANCWA